MASSEKSRESEELFDAEFLARLRSMFLQLRKRRVLKNRGAQPTPATGFTREFKDHRPYTVGDDYREIDWQLYARLDKLFIRLFEEVQQFHVHVLLDRSLSMAEPHGAKRVAALKLAAAVSYLALSNQHRVSLMTVTDQVERQLPPLEGQGHLQRLLDELAGLRFEGGTRLEHALRRYQPGRDRRGIVFLISDLFGESLQDADRALGRVGQWRAETHAIQIIDPRERDPGLEGELRLIETETRQERLVQLDRRDLERYRETFDRFVEQVQQRCRQRQVNYMQWPADEPFEQMFMALLARGSALAQQ